MSDSPLAYTPPPGTAQLLMYRLMCLLDVLVGKRKIADIPPPTEAQTYAEGIKVKGGRTQNYKVMGRTGAHLYYALSGDEASALKFQRQVLSIFEQEKTEGQMLSEGGCSQPHDGMHLSAKYMSLYFALIHKDKRTIEEARGWCEGFLSYCEACSVKANNRPLFVGTRIKTYPTSHVRELLYDISRGEKVRVPKKIETDRYYTSVRVALLLDKMNQSPQSTGKIPRMYGDVTIDTNNGIKTITMTHPPDKGIAPHEKREIVTRINIREDDGSYNFTRLSGETEEGD